MVSEEHNTKSDMCKRQSSILKPCIYGKFFIRKVGCLQLRSKGHSAHELMISSGCIGYRKIRLQWKLMGFSFGHHQTPLIWFPQRLLLLVLLLSQVRMMHWKTRKLPMICGAQSSHGNAREIGLAHPERVARDGSSHLCSSMHVESTEDRGPVEHTQTSMSLGWLSSRDKGRRWCRGSSRRCRVNLTAIPSSRNIMVVFPLICGDHRFQVMWCPLNMLSNNTSRIGALVITPKSCKNHKLKLETNMNMFHQSPTQLHLSINDLIYLNYNKKNASIPWIWVAFDNFLPIFAPAITIIKYIHFTGCLYYYSWFPDSSRCTTYFWYANIKLPATISP